MGIYSTKGQEISELLYCPNYERKIMKSSALNSK
jgi:hypothetical protein